MVDSTQHQVVQVRFTILVLKKDAMVKREYVEDVMGALTSLTMTANFILQSNGQTYFISESTSDTQLNAMKEYFDCREWWYEVK